MNAEERDDVREQTIQRLAALLLTVPGWQRNYTATMDAARWMVSESEKIGWVLMVNDAVLPLWLQGVPDRQVEAKP